MKIKLKKYSGLSNAVLTAKNFVVAGVQVFKSDEEEKGKTR